MSSPTKPTPSQEATRLLADVQKQALRGMIWAIIAFLPIQLYFWHRRPLADRSAISLAFEITLLAGVAIQLLGFRRLSVRTSGILFTTWLGIIVVLAWFTTGPLMTTGFALVCTSLVALFFINKRAGAAVVLGFGVLVVVHAQLAGRGIIEAYTTGIGKPPATTSTLMRGGLSNFATLAVCYACFAMIHHALVRVLGQAETERRNRAAAETAQRKAEDTMRANQHFEALGKLSSGVAHDVNNSLTAVLCNAELLRYALPPGTAQQGINDILSAAQSAAQTTRQLLSLSRRSFCVPLSVDPAAELKTASRLAARVLPETIWISAEGGGTRRILVDPADLQQALLNLLLNARDAMPKGGAIVLRHEDIALDGGRPGVAVRVRDNGSGIPPEVLPRIFDPFFTTKAPGHGTGLGLAMVKAFVEEAGGTIDLQSAPGQGTTVSLLFPESQVAPTPFASELMPPPPGQHLLLIEDREDLRQLMERVLRRGGYEVTACASCDEAMAELEKGGRFTLLCTDGVGGSTPVTSLIAGFRAGRPAAPVLLFSGHADHELVAAGLDKLQVELLRKPFTGTELLARLGTLARFA